MAIVTANRRAPTQTGSPNTVEESDKELTEDEGDNTNGRAAFTNEGYTSETNQDNLSVPLVSTSGRVE